MPISRYGLKNDASTSSRLNPQVVCVRSLVPKEKNSADSAIRSAVSAARGSSIMVPIANPKGQPFLASTSRRTRSASARVKSNSAAVATSGIMISALGSLPRARSAQAASAIARTWRANRPGRTKPKRTPRRPSIGFCSDKRFTSCRSATFDSSTAPRSLARATSTASSVRSGRNSCSGGSINRMVTGNPSMASRTSVKSAICSGSNAASAASRSSSLLATINFSTYILCSPRNMCSVRSRPMPCAPIRRARAASGPLSALVRTPSLRRESA